MEIWVFLAKNSPKKPASQLHPGTLAVLVRYNQTQKCLQYDPKGFQQKKMIQWNFLLTNLDIKVDIIAGGVPTRGL